MVMKRCTVLKPRKLRTEMAEAGRLMVELELT